MTNEIEDIWRAQYEQDKWEILEDNINSQMWQMWAGTAIAIIASAIISKIILLL